MVLDYQDYCRYYALKCGICQGEKRLKHKGIWTACVCQNTASLKFRFEQFDIHPAELKYKNWDDFTGIDGTNILTTDSFISAKQKALEYCFGSSDPKSIKDRRNKLIVHKHCSDARNVIVVGSKGTGKTMIAALIIKEVAHACRIHNLNISFKCVKSVFLQDAARWNTQGKSVDQHLLDELSEVDFLVIDGVETDDMGHTTPPDSISLNVLFSSRSGIHPTIIVCSDNFWRDVKNYRNTGHIINRWGREFLSIMRDPTNVVIELEKAQNVGR